MFNKLPSEVFERVFAFVNKADLLNLRLTCSQLQRESFHAFGVAFFSVINLEFCVGTFPRFDRIAFDGDLCPFVREIRFGHDSCRDISCEKLSPLNHRLGQGNKWPRKPSGCLDMSATAVLSFRSLLANRLIKCHSICLSDKSGTNPYADGSDSSLSVTDSVYLLLFAIAGLPIKSFRMEFHRMSKYLQPRELPRSVIDSPLFISSWATSLTDLQLDWDIEQDELLSMAVDMISRAKSMRKLYLRTQHSSKSNNFLSRVADAPELPPLTHLVLASLKDVKPAELCAFICRFGNSLVDLHLTTIKMLSGEHCTWPLVFSRCKREFPRLGCITMSNCWHGGGSESCVFDQLLQRKEVPESGKLEFLSRLIKGKTHVFGIRYEGTGEAMNKVLHGLEESVCSERPLISNYENSQYPERLLVTGKLRAEKVSARKFDTVFDQPFQ